MLHNLLSAGNSQIAELIKNKDFYGLVDLAVSKIPALIAAVVIIIIGVIVSKLMGNLVVKGMSKKGIDPSVHSFIRTIFVFIINMIFIISALSTLGFNISSFVTALGAAGITAGLGLQSSISQFASGIQILVNHPFKSGDYVEIGTVSGKVQEIKMMYTALITIDNKRIIIPNSTITTSNIINYNAENRRRVDLVYSVSYDADIAKVKDVLRGVIAENKLILTDPEPIIGVSEHAASSVNISCLIWCKSDDYWDIFYYMQETVKNAFDQNGIPIPYNQLDVHITKE